MWTSACRRLYGSVLNRGVFNALGIRASHAAVAQKRLCLQHRWLSTANEEAGYAPNVTAFYIARRIRMAPLFQKVYGTRKHWLEHDSIIISFPKNESNQTADQYAVFYDYGAAVFFNCSAVLQRESVAYAREFCEGFITQDSAVRGDDYTVVVNPGLEKWSKFAPNLLEVQELDLNNVKVISSVLGQTVALNHFEQMLDGMLKTFESANLSPQGNFAQLFGKNRQIKVVFDLLRESNMILVDVILKLGLLDRTRMRDTAWKYDKYFFVWEGLRDEFELQSRWSILNTKAEYLQHNMKFFIELLHSRKGERLEWMIIVLIAMELLVSLYGVVNGVSH